MSEVDDLIKHFREDPYASWVADQIEDTISQGISMNAKDAHSDEAFFELEPSDITQSERNKRQKYETSRPYTDEEKNELVKAALEAFFKDFPAVSESIFERMGGLGVQVSSIVFVSDDDSLGEREIVHDLSKDDVTSSRKKCEDAYRNFLSEVDL